jgi:hypothetical protein
MIIDHALTPQDSPVRVETDNTDIDNSNELVNTDFIKAKNQNMFIKNINFNYNQRKKSPTSFLSNKLACNQSKVPNKSSKYFMNDSSQLPVNDKYNLYSNHSFSVNPEKASLVSLMCI